MNGNRSGRTLEDAIADLLVRQWCEFERQADVGISIYGTAIRADFIVHNIVEYPLGVVIEAKWQDVTGTADEKFPYLVANIKAGAYRRPVIAVVSGGGCRAGAVNWLRGQIDGQGFVFVFSFEALMSWLQRHVHVRATSRL